jgi:hypothetical protein
LGVLEAAECVAMTAIGAAFAGGFFAGAVLTVVAIVASDALFGRSKERG